MLFVTVNGVLRPDWLWNLSVNLLCYVWYRIRSAKLTNIFDSEQIFPLIL